MPSTARRDANSVTTLLAVSSADGISIVEVWADPTTHRLLVESIGGGGGTDTWYQDEILTPNGSQTIFNLAHSGATAVFVSINGQIQYSGGQDYTLSNSNATITFGTAPLSTDIIRVTYVVTTTTWYQDETPSGTQNGVNAVFTLAHTPANVVFVSLNGQLQYGAGKDFTLSGANIIFNVPPLSNDVLRVTYS